MKSNAGEISASKVLLSRVNVQVTAAHKNIVHVAETGQLKGKIWSMARPLFAARIRDILRHYTIEGQKFEAAYPGQTFDDVEQEILQALSVFDREPPFTLQRLAEVLAYPLKYYRSLRKLTHSLIKLLSVTSTAS